MTWENTLGFRLFVVGWNILLQCINISIQRRLSVTALWTKTSEWPGQSTQWRRYSSSSSVGSRYWYGQSLKSPVSFSPTFPPLARTPSIRGLSAIHSSKLAKHIQGRPSRGQGTPRKGLHTKRRVPRTLGSHWQDLLLLLLLRSRQNRRSTQEWLTVTHRQTPCRHPLQHWMNTRNKWPLSHRVII